MDCNDDAACDGLMRVPNDEHTGCGKQNKWEFIYNKSALWTIFLPTYPLPTPLL